MDGIKTAIMLSATCKERLSLAFWCSHMQDFFFSFAECEQFFNAVVKYLSWNKFISFLERGTGLCYGISCKSELNATSFYTALSACWVADTLVCQVGEFCFFMDTGVNLFYLDA